MAETPEYFDNIVLGQYSMTGVPLKVYANDRYYIIPSPEDVDDPLIGYGMTGSGKMEPFDYRDIEHIMVSGNKVDLATYVKALGDELKGVAKANAEKGGEGESKEGGEEEKKEEEGGGTNPFESFDPYSKKWSLKSLVELSKDEFKAQEDALKAEMEAGKAKIKAAKDKMSDLKKQPIEDGVIYEADEIKAKIAKLERDLADVKHKYYSTAKLTPQKDMQLRKQMGQISRELKRAKREDRTGASGYEGKPLKTVTESVISDILVIAFESTTYDKFIAELIKQKLLKREDLKDPELVDELKTMYRGQALGKRESVNENHISEPYIFQVGDVIRNTNPQCKHFGSMGIVQSVMDMDDNVGQLIKYLVTNYGDTFKPGMSLTKTPDQLEPADAHHNNDWDDWDDADDAHDWDDWENHHDGDEDDWEEYEIEYDDDDIDESVSINEYGATPSKKNWLGWFVLNANLNGDLTAWKKGELIKAYKSDEKGYVFIYTGDYNYDAYDDIAQSDFNRIATPLDPTKHKKSYNYVKKLEKLNRLEDYEVIN